MKTFNENLSGTFGEKRFDSAEKQFEKQFESLSESMSENKPAENERNKEKEKFYNVAVSDFDGTLARTDKTISEETLGKIRSFISRGGKFAVCTGRMTSSILPVCRKYGLGDYVVSFQGAAINEVKSGKSVYFNPLSAKIVAKLCAFAKSRKVNMQVYPDGVFMVLRKTDETEFYSSITGVKYEVRQDIGEYFLAENKQTGKALFYVGDNDAEKLCAEIQKIAGDEADVFISNPRQIDVCARGVSKGAGVKKLLDIIKISGEKTRVMCFGDEHNDLSMLKTADFSVAPENAHADVKAVVDYVCESNDEGGVGNSIEKFGI